ncbi:MAG: GC-type dockerin domain-anchored protein [Phycisphaerales bacterium]
MLYTPTGNPDAPNSQWIPLAVAGGGGGGRADLILNAICFGGSTGNGGGLRNCDDPLTPCGQAFGGSPGAGAGGGLFQAASHGFVGYEGINGKIGFPDGGDGGQQIGTLRGADGGWGCGGGGAACGAYRGESVWIEDEGAGGGGYQGGEPSGGGGTSYINLDYALAGDIYADSHEANHGYAFYLIDADVHNDHPADAVALIDGDERHGNAHCGATPTDEPICGIFPGEDDVWYTYTNTTLCDIDLTVSISQGTARIEGYDVGDPVDLQNCRTINDDVTSPYLDTLTPGQTVYFRVRSIDPHGFTLLPSSAFTPGQLDCDNDGIPDACDTLDDCRPPNDDVSGAILVAEGSYDFDMSYSTVQSQFADPACNTLETTGDIWFKFAAPSDGQLLVRERYTTDQERDDRGIAVYSSDLLAEITCDVNENAPYYHANSAVFLPMSAHDTVYIRVFSRGEPSGTHATLDIDFDESFPNDNWWTATEVVLPHSTSETFIYNLFTARRDASYQPSCREQVEDIDAWYEYFTSPGGPVVFTPEVGQTLTVYQDGFSGPGAEIACLRPTTTGESITLDLLSATTVWVRVGDTWSPSSDVDRTLTIETLCFDGPDSDGDGTPDACELDCDASGVADEIENTVANAIDLGLIAQPGTVHLDTLSSGFNTELALWDESGALLATNDDAAPANPPLPAIRQSLIVMDLGEGVYTLAATGHDFEFSEGFTATTVSDECTTGGSLALTIEGVTHVSTQLSQGRVQFYTFRVGPQACSPADIAEPYGQLDFSDVVTYLMAFGMEDPGADFAEPFDSLDFSDVIEFLVLFAAGCP